MRAVPSVSRIQSEVAENSPSLLIIIFFFDSSFGILMYTLLICSIPFKVISESIFASM